jgi:glycosyltransferase involved in cell wall biosynthesis
MPKVSIIIPSFNSEKVLAAAIESVLNQSFSDFELLIIDGLSTDNTLNIAKSYVDSRIIIISEKDKGIYDAMNKGAELASGLWLYFLGSDDILLDNNVLQRVFEDNKIITENSDFLYANIILGDTDEIYGGYRDIFILYKYNISHQAIFVKKNILVNKGYFALKYKILADYYFNMLCFTDDNIKKLYLNIIIARFALNGASGTTKDPFVNEKYQLFEQHIRNISFESLIHFRVNFNTKNGIVNKLTWLVNILLLYVLNIFFVREFRNIIYKFTNN